MSRAGQEVQHQKRPATARPAGDEAPPPAPGSEEQPAGETVAGYAWQQPYLTGDWGGTRTKLADRGLTYEASYTGEVGGNVLGGLSRGASYLGNLDLKLTVDAEKLLGWPGATFHFYGLHNHGTRGPSALIGDLQTVSNIEAPAAFKLYEATLEQRLWGGRLAILVGLYDLNSELDTTETGGLFLNSSHGIGADFSQSGRNGPSIFPATSLAIRLKALPAPSLYVLAAAFDGVPGDPDSPWGTQIVLDEDDGALLAVELGYAPAEGRKLALGAWAYTASFDHVSATDASGLALRAGGSFGIYGLAEHPVYRAAGDRGLAAFARIGYANEDLNPIGWYTGGGLVYTGLVPTRDEDQLGFAVAAAHVSHKLRRGTAVDAAEIALEWTYRVRLTPWLSARPDAQWVINPGADPALDNAIFLAARWEIML